METTLDDTDLRQAFDTEIRPALADLEKQRYGALIRFFLAATLGVAAFLSIAPAAIQAHKHFGDINQLATPATVFGLFAVAAAGAFFARRSYNGFRGAMRDVLMPVLCAHIDGLTYRRKPERAFPFQRFKQLELLPAHTSSKQEDFFEGHHRDTHFSMVEAILRRKSGSGKNSSTKTVFRGLMLAIGVPAAFSGTIMIARERGTLGRIFAELSGRRDPIPLGIEEFDTRFDLFADDKALVDQLITPEFARDLIRIDNMEGVGAMTAAFDNGTFLLALPMGRDLFEPGSIFRSVTGAAAEGELLKLLSDIRIPYRIIDILHGAASD